MRGRTRKWAVVLVLSLAFSALGCIRASGPLDLTSQNPYYDQEQIASYYTREANNFKLKAQELSQRASVYEGLFGSDSEWVKGTRLLEQFYEYSAQEQERLAAEHLDIAGRERQSLMVRPAGP
ncbi:MAG TPA: hypothetical protein VLD60_06960 [Nitrospira sp.]|nr:hypothetical protein [Nitrospira sp.]